MTLEERNAITSFMYVTLNTLYPDYRDYPLKEIEAIYEIYGEESEEFKDLPYYQVAAFFMKRAIDVIAERS